jgi:hypothetical protein
MSLTAQIPLTSCLEEVFSETRPRGAGTLLRRVKDLPH